MKEKFNKLFLIFYVWTIGMVGGILFWLLVVLGRVRVEGYKLKKILQFIKFPGGKIVIHNHPSLIEPALIPFLFFPFYLFFPSAIPYSTPDKKNCYAKWWFIPLRPVSVPVQRGEEREEEKEGKFEFHRRLLEKIKKGCVVILAPEGGRTFRGGEFGEFKVIKNGKIMIRKSWQKVKDESFKIRRFQKGLSSLLRKQTAFLPVWTEGGEEIIPNKDSFSKTLLSSFPKFWIGEIIKSQDLSNLEELEEVLLKCSIRKL